MVGWCFLAYSIVLLLLAILSTFKVIRGRWFMLAALPVIAILGFLALLIESDRRTRVEPRGIRIKPALPMSFYLASPKLSNFSMPSKLYDFTGNLRKLL